MRNLLQVTIKGDKEKNLKEIAQILGFKSLEDLKKETELAVENSETGDYWFISRLPDGRWAAFEDEGLLEFDLVDYFASREEAVRFVRLEFDLAAIPESSWLIEIPKGKMLIGYQDENYMSHYFLRNIGEEIPFGWKIIYGRFFPKEQEQATGIFKAENGYYYWIEHGKSSQLSKDPLEFMMIGEKWRFGKIEISIFPDPDDVRFSIFHIRNEGIQQTKSRDYVREIIRNIPTHE